MAGSNFNFLNTRGMEIPDKAAAIKLMVIEKIIIKKISKSLNQNEAIKPKIIDQKRPFQKETINSLDNIHLMLPETI